MKNLTDYYNELLLIKDSPQKMSELLLEASADYSYYMEQSIELEIKKARFMDEEKYKTAPPLSDKACENKWRLTPDGEQDIRIHRKLKGLEKIMSSIKSATIVATVSAKNQY